MKNLCHFVLNLLVAPHCSHCWFLISEMQLPYIVSSIIDVWQTRYKKHPYRLFKSHTITFYQKIFLVVKQLLGLKFFKF